MRIRRSRLTKNYLQVPNATVRDERLSHMARGILVELLSRPDGWETNADEMWRTSVAARGRESPGRRMFRAAFAELKDLGYMSSSREALPGGKYATILTVTDVPHAGTSGPPAGKSIPAARTDVPFSDVPHAGTSKTEDGQKNTGKTEPPPSSGPNPSESQIKTAAHSSLRSEQLPSDGMADRQGSEGDRPVVGTATIPGAERDLGGRRKTAAEIEIERKQHNQQCRYCQQGPKVCDTAAGLVRQWIRAVNREAS